MRMCQFRAQNSTFAQMIIFSENLLINLAPFIQAYLRAKNQSWYSSINEILTMKEYWNLTGQEQFLALTWEPNFSQAYSFCRMLMNHKNFCFTQILDKTNDIIFLKSPKILFLGHFWSFLPNGDFFKTIRLSHTTI